MDYTTLNVKERAIVEMVLSDLEDKYQISSEECLRFLYSLKREEKKITRVRRISFDGVIHEDKCQAISFNKKQYTQCRFSIVDGFYCKRHSRNRKYGNIRDRLSEDWKPGCIM
jgi:hypothetical protein